MKTSTAVPTNPAALSTWATDFEARHGVPPMAGGEVFGVGAVATPPAPAPAPAPAQAAPAPAPAPAPAAAPAAQPPAGQPPAPAGAPEGQPGGEAQAPQGTPPDWAQTLIERMDEIAPPIVDPLAAELFGTPAPPQAAPQGLPPGLTPDQLAAAQAAGLGQQPGAQLPGLPPQALPGGMPAVPPTAPGLPGQQPGQLDEGQIVSNFIDQRAQEVAQRMIRERVDPYIQSQETQRRRNEAIALTQDYPEFRDPAYQSSISQRARGWAQQILGSPEAAGEPGFLELCHLAAKQLEAMRQEIPAGAAPGGEVPIETPGGANPGGAATQTDQLAAGIAAASQGRGLSPLWR